MTDKILTDAEIEVIEESHSDLDNGLYVDPVAIASRKVLDRLVRPLHRDREVLLSSHRALRAELEGVTTIYVKWFYGAITSCDAMSKIQDKLIRLEQS